jgi:hypothetical protein
MISEVENVIAKQSQPTALSSIVENQNSYRIGFTALMALSLATNALGRTTTFSERMFSYNSIENHSFTNLAISDIKNKWIETVAICDLLDEDYFDFSIKPMYTGEFKIKVESFKIEKFVPTSF